MCVKAKGTGAQHGRQTNKELAKQEQYGPRIYSDFLYVCEVGVSTPMLALRFSRSGRMAATALEQKGLTQYGVKFFAGFIQQTGVRMFINKSDGEPAMKALKDAAAKALEGIESIAQESPVGDHQANGDIESTVRTLKAQMGATRFALESRLGRQLAHDDPFLTRIPTFAGDTIARFRKVPDGETLWEREQGRKWAGGSLEFGERFFMKEAKERASGAVKRDWEPKLIEARYLGQHARTGAMMSITADGIVCGRRGSRLPEAERWPSQAQPRQSEENEGDQNLSGPETKLNKEYDRNEPNSTRHLQRLHQEQMHMRTTASKPKELEGKTLEGENPM